MEKYVEGSMSKDEIVQVKAKYHWLVWAKFYVSLFFWGLIALVCAFVSLKMYSYDNENLAIIFLIMTLFILFYILWILFELKLTEMACTNKRIIYKTGIISLKTEEIKVDKIEAIQIEQTFWGRILGYGDIIFSGTGTTKVKFCDVSNPWKIKSKIEEALDETVKELKTKNIE